MPLFRKLEKENLNVEMCCLNNNKSLEKIISKKMKSLLEVHLKNIDKNKNILYWQVHIYKEHFRRAIQKSGPLQEIIVLYYFIDYCIDFTCIFLKNVNSKQILACHII